MSVNINNKQTKMGRKESQILAGKRKKKKVAQNNASKAKPPKIPPVSKAQAQKLGMQIMSERAASTANKLCLSDPKLRGLVRNMISPTEAFCIPRLIPTRPAPKRYYGTVKVPTVKDVSNRFSTVMVVRPEPNNFISFGTQSSGKSWLVSLAAGQNNSHVLWPAGEWFTYDTTLQSQPGGSQLKASTLKGAPGYHFSNSRNMWVPGFKYFPMSSCQFTASRLKVSIPGVVATADCALSLQVAIISEAGVVTPLHTQTYNLLAGQSTNINGNLLIANSDNLNIEGIAFGFSLNQNVYATFGQSSAALIQQDPNDNPVPVSSGIAMSWTTHTLWEFLDSNNARAQFESANSYAVTGLSVLVQNSTAKYYKNGRVYGGKLQGGTVLPGSFSGICTFLSTINKKYASYSGLLEKGMHWFYTPDKLQDYEFFNATNRADSPCPFMVCAIDGSWSEEGPPEFYLTFSVNIECLGQDVGLTYLDSPKITGLYPGLVSALASVDPFSENPDHLKHIAQTIKKVLTNPDVLSAVGTAVQYGLKAAPIVASLL